MVRKYFNDYRKSFNGKIQGLAPGCKMGMMWRVAYEDGEYDDYTREELGEYIQAVNTYLSKQPARKPTEDVEAVTESRLIAQWWTTKRGRGLVSFYYIRPGIDPASVPNEARSGVDYFCSEADAVAYVLQKGAEEGGGERETEPVQKRVRFAKTRYGD